MDVETLPTASTSAQALILPYITVQHDLQAVIQDVTDGTVSSESFWVSVYRQGSPSVHGKVLVRASMEDEHSVDLEPSDGITFERAQDSSTSFLVSCEKLKVPKTLVKMPKQVQRGVMPKGVHAMDVSPNGKLYVVGGRDGALQVGSTRDDSPGSTVQLLGHVGDILSCKFFPSSEVLLSTSLDLSIRIFSALDGSNPRTLTGHTAAVTDAAIIGRGRHIVSSGNDGYLRLWNVGEAKCLKSWKLGQGSRKRVTKVALLDLANSSGDASTGVQEEVKGKVAVAGLEDGSISFTKLDSSALDLPLQTLQISAKNKAISALAVRPLSDGGYCIAVGTADGVITLLQYSDLNTPPRVLASIKRNDADITSLAFSSASTDSLIQLLVATMDGLPFQVSVGISGSETTPRIELELAGYDIDASNGVVDVEGELYVGGMDGHLRRY